METPYLRKYVMTQDQIDRCIAYAKTRFPITDKTRIEIMRQPPDYDPRRDWEEHQAEIDALTHAFGEGADALVWNNIDIAFAYIAEADALWVRSFTKFE